MAEHQLPPLPECDSYCTHKDMHDYEVWSAEQMREYALAAIALASPPVAVQEEGDALVAALKGMLEVFGVHRSNLRGGTTTKSIEVEVCEAARAAIAAMKGDQP